MYKKSGFTLIELVIIILLTGILAVTAIPKFNGNDGFETQTYRDQLQQLLKTVQQQAMSCGSDCRTSRATNPYACNRVVITASRFGIPTNCGSALPTSFTAPHLGMSTAEANSTKVGFSVTNTADTGIIEFDEFGIANGCSTRNRGCSISIIGEQTLSLRIEAQGFIHEN
ncbi:prepilin-type N-terminal cleavage/methylation domain-containing protein [Moritella sp. 36]|uniref:prepilin-type N-terminal cleavage/methylation domain-containing protein n=1 Tax=Moritella sp. 36 TaxID=2746233 RepID=UPI001BA723D9|nr:prepilin-type N-terminal cleavage/methylation domain-containing protein [Moritella sp. 36]QUM87512.1 prepilin-type N-terminal cleavage/methylation domain-containing protein [Moritella sp. 36]